MTYPIVTKIRRYNGVAGQFGYSALVQYEDEPAKTVDFVSSVYGPPIVLITPDGFQIVVSNRVTERLGSTLNPEWIRQFFAPKEAQS